MSLFSVLASLANRRAANRAAAGAGAPARRRVVDRNPGFTARDKKRGAGTRAGFGRRTGRADARPPGAPTAAAARTPRPPRFAGARAFVSNAFARLRGRAGSGA